MLPSPGRGWPGQSPGRVWGGTQNRPVAAPLPPLRRHLPPREGKGSPAGRKPSPTGKVDRAQPGPDEGCRTKITKQATLNGKRFRSTWPVFDFSVVFPHPSGPLALPPSPWGKATSRRGSVHRGPDLTFRGPLLFSGPCVFWHCMVQCPKIGKRQVERGAFSVQSQDPAGHYGVLCEAPEPMAPG